MTKTLANILKKTNKFSSFIQNNVSYAKFMLLWEDLQWIGAKKCKKICYQIFPSHFPTNQTPQQQPAQPHQQTVLSKNFKN